MNTDDTDNTDKHKLKSVLIRQISLIRVFRVLKKRIYYEKSYNYFYRNAADS